MRESWKVTHEPAWRSQPPTDNQIKTLRRLDFEEKGKFMRPRSRGEASDRIRAYGIRWDEKADGWHD